MKVTTKTVCIELPLLFIVLAHLENLNLDDMEIEEDDLGSLQVEAGGVRYLIADDDTLQQILKESIQRWLDEEAYPAMDQISPALQNYFKEDDFIAHASSVQPEYYLGYALKKGVYGVSYATISTWLILNWSFFKRFASRDEAPIDDPFTSWEVEFEGGYLDEVEGLSFHIFSNM